MERPSQQSIQRRGLLHLGFDKLSYKTLSKTTPGGIPTGFHMVNIHLGKELGRYAAQRLQTGLPSACWGRPRQECGNAR